MGSIFQGGLADRDPIHGLGELHIQFGQAPGIVGGKRHFNGLVDVEPFRMMIHFFRDQRRAGHEAEGLVEVLENEFFRDGVPAGHLRPAVEPRQRGFSGFTGQFLRHDLEPHCSERATLAMGSHRYYLFRVDPDHTRHPCPGHLNIGKVAGTVVRVHLTFLLFLAWIFAASYASGGAATAGTASSSWFLLFLCVLLHEFGHILTARAFDVPTPYVTLLPIGGVAQLERIPEEPWEEFLIAIAGPMVNIVIMAALMVLFDAQLQPSAAAAVDNLKIPLVDRLAAVNLFLALFNMIPAFPMDGGRVLRALLATRLGYVRATEIAAAYRTICRIRARLYRPAVQSDPDLYRHLRLSRRLLGGAHGRACARPRAVFR